MRTGEDGCGARNKRRLSRTNAQSEEQIYWPEMLYLWANWALPTRVPPYEVCMDQGTKGTTGKARGLVFLHPSCNSSGVKWAEGGSASGHCMWPDTSMASGRVTVSRSVIIEVHTWRCAGVPYSSNSVASGKAPF